MHLLSAKYIMLHSVSSCLYLADIQFRATVVQSTCCTCAPGKSLYHHTIAVLYQLQHYSKLDLKVVPPLASKTSQPQVYYGNEVKSSESA